MKYFFDNCLAPRLARGIDAFLGFSGQHQAIHLREKFSPDTKDVIWIAGLMRDGDWVVISGDIRITRNKAELAAWKESRLTGFFFGKSWMRMNPWDQAWKLTKFFPDIVRQSQLVLSGATFEVTQNGKFKQLFL